MISEKLQNAINEQITAEMWSSNLYLSMSFYLQKEGFDGFASWMRKQSQEELQHAYDLADYLVKRGGAAKVDKLMSFHKDGAACRKYLNMYTSTNVMYPA